MDVAASPRNLLSLLIRLGHKVAKFAIRALHLSRRDGKQHGLGALDDLFRVNRGVVGQSADLIGRPDDLTQHGVTTDDAGMMLPVGERERIPHELEDIRLPAHGLELVDGVQIVDEGDGVDWNRAFVHRAHGDENRLV